MNTSFGRVFSLLITGSALIAAVGCNGLERASNEVATAVTTAAPTNAVAKPAAEPAPQPIAPRVPEPANLAPGLEGVVKLAKAGIPEDVIMAYVAQTTNTFSLTPDDLIYLTDIGVPPSVLTLMQQRGNRPPSGPVAPAPSPNVATAPAVTAPASNAAPTPPPPASVPTNVITPTYVGQPALPPADPNAPPPPPAGTPVQDPVVVAPPTQVVSVPYFYDALSPHGTWIDVPGYGRCWRPNYGVLGSNWQPYADGGHWVWTDYGWYWVSDYAWGWAPFHYGRWCHVARHGWLWTPDTVWGPAWVCWRRSSSHCGWAPLPPGAYYAGSSWYFGGGPVSYDYGFNIGFAFFNFVPWGRFCEPHPRHFYASRSHAASLYRDSTVVNNTVIGNNNTVIFQGVGRQAVQQASSAPIPQASIRQTAWTSANASLRERADVSQSGIVIQSPRIPSAPPTKPGSVQGSGKWASQPATTGPSSPSSSSEKTSSVAERGGLGLREEAFRSGRTGFEPLAGAGQVYLPSTRSTAITPAPAAAPAATTATASSPSSTTPAVAATPRSTPITAGSGLSDGAGGKRWNPPATRPGSLATAPGSTQQQPLDQVAPRTGVAVPPASVSRGGLPLRPTGPASETGLGASTRSAGLAPNLGSPSSAGAMPSTQPRMTLPSLTPRIAGSGDAGSAADFRSRPVQTSSGGFSQPSLPARSIPSSTWSSPSPSPRSGPVMMPDRTVSAPAAMPAPITRSGGGPAYTPPASRYGPVTAPSQPASSGGARSSGGRRDH